MVLEKICVDVVGVYIFFVESIRVFMFYVHLFIYLFWIHLWEDSVESILVVTETFPYGEGEVSFFKTEFEYLCQKYNVHLSPMNADVTSGGVYSTQSNVTNDLINKRISIINVVKAMFDKCFWSEVKRIINQKRGIVFAIKAIPYCLLYLSSAYSYKAQINLLVNQYDIKMIYTYWGSPATIGALLLKERKHTLRVITRLHGYDLYNERNRVDWQPFRFYMASCIDIICFVSKMGKDYFLQHWGGKGVVSYIGTLNRKQIKAKNDGVFRIVSCSSLIPLKRVDLIIDALSQVSDCIKIEWHHFGDGSEKEYLEGLAMDLLSKKENILYSFEGWKNNEDLIKSYVDILPDLFISTSYSEGLPVSIQEAISMGIVTLSTDVGGVRELIVDGKTGFIIPRDVSGRDIAQKIEKVMELSDEQKNEISRNAFLRQREYFNADENAKRFLKIIDQEI